MNFYTRGRTKSSGIPLLLPHTFNPSINALLKSGSYFNPSSPELILLLHNAQFSIITPSGARKIPIATSTIPGRSVQL